MQKDFFSVKARLFWVRFERCCCFCMVVRALSVGVLWCGSAWFVVRFNVG